MKPETMTQLMRDAAEVKRLLRLMASRTDTPTHGAEVTALWRTVRTVCSAAFVEHLRLTGTDVSALEQELVERGEAPWRDLIVPTEDKPDEVGEDQAPQQATAPAVSVGEPRTVSITLTVKLGRGGTHE